MESENAFESRCQQFEAKKVKNSLKSEKVILKNRKIKQIESHVKTWITREISKVVDEEKVIKAKIFQTN